MTFSTFGRAFLDAFLGRVRSPTPADLSAQSWWRDFVTAFAGRAGIAADAARARSLPPMRVEQLSSEHYRTTHYTRSHAEVIRKAFWVFLTGTTAFLITNVLDQPPVWQLMTPILIGSITLLVRFLKDIENRLEKLGEKQDNHAIELLSLIDEGFVRTNKATELFQAVEASALQTDAVIQLVRNSTQIAPASPPLFYEFAQLQIDRMSEFLRELSGGGVVEYDDEDRDWILGLTMRAKHTIDAISLSAVDAGSSGFDGRLWTSDHGRYYLKLQREAMSRGVVIRRLFIVDRPEQVSETEFLRVYQQHEDLGIQVRVLERSKVPETLPLLDFVVFDGVLSYEVTPSSLIEYSGEPTTIKTHLILKSEKVKERMRRFEELWILGQKLEVTGQVSVTDS
ncbi:MAG: DUF6879 family protein [Pseudonocardiaceae bacterium]